MSQPTMAGLLQVPMETKQRAVSGGHMANRATLGKEVRRVASFRRCKERSRVTIKTRQRAGTISYMANRGTLGEDEMSQLR